MDQAQSIAAGLAGADLVGRNASTRRRHLGHVLAALLLTVLGFPNFAIAAEEASPKNVLLAGYKQELSRKRNNIPPILRTGEIPDAAAAAEFKEYFQRFALVQVILPGRDLNKERKLLKTTYFSNQLASNPARDLLNQTTLDFMKQAAGSKDLPLEARYSAMLVLADLNEFEGRPPKALPKTLPFFLGIVKSTTVPDAFKVVSLLGIKNHAESNATYPVDAKDKVDLDKTLLDLITSKPPENRSPEGHQWLRRMAIEILGIMGDVDTKDTKNAIARALDRIVTSADEPLSVRCAAAQALGLLKFLPNSTEFKTAATDIGSLLVDVCAQELASAKQKEEVPSRRRLEHLALTVREGIAGPAGAKSRGLLNTAAKTEDRQSVEAVSKKTSELIKIIESTSDSGLADAIEEWLGKSKESLRAKPAEKSGGAPGGEPDGARAEVRRKLPAAN
jgi:hypothetical protein